MLPQLLIIRQKIFLKKSPVLVVGQRKLIVVGLTVLAIDFYFEVIGVAKGSVQGQVCFGLQTRNNFIFTGNTAE